MGKILIAPNREEIEGSLIFLAGPIQGAPDWHSEAIGFLSVNPHVSIASPRRAHQARGDFNDGDYSEQILWEWEHMTRAGQNGVILFWLASPGVEVPGRAYAQTTRFELGETITRHIFTGIRVVVGIEDGFSNRRYITKSLKEKTPNIPLCSSLKETCEAALLMCNEINK